MDQEKITELIKKNKWLLRQLTSLNNEVKELRDRVKKLEKRDTYYPSREETTNIKIGGD